MLTSRVMLGTCLTVGAGVGLLTAGDACALTAEVKRHQGAPALFVNGTPTAPLVFFGWAAAGKPYTFELGTTWQTYGFSFTAPEDNDGHFGVHIRLGGSGPGTVWIDDVRLVEGERDDNAARPNLLQSGGWESSKEEMSRVWFLFTNEALYGSKADWAVVSDEVAEGKQACRVNVLNGGASTMHCHFYQSGMSCRKGQRFTYTLKMKADRTFRGDLLALHHGEPWTLYPPDATDSVYQSQVRLAAAAGIHIHSFGIDMPWPKPGDKPDFRNVARAFDLTLAADPQALFLPRFGMSAPGWWQTQYPDQCLLFDDGKTHGESPASARWREDCLEHLRALVRFCEDNYGEHLLGYHPCGQHTGEWFYERSWEPRLSGFCPAMETGFRAWLKTQYATDTALRTAWGNPQVTLATATVPTAAEQRTARLGLFRDPVQERQAIDFFAYKQLAMLEPLEAMARVIKEETRRQKLVTLFYGYFFDMCGIPSGPQISGHLAMERMLRCPDVDILCSPISYFDRQCGGSGPFMTAVDSVAAAGKLWLNEDDTRTHLTPPDSGFGRVDTPAQTDAVLRRNFANILPRRMACWYMDLGGTGWFNGPGIWDGIRTLKTQYDASLAEPATFAPEVAVIVDEQSPNYLACTRTIMNPQCYELRRRLYRFGTPFRTHFLGDLLAGTVPPCRAYLFLDLFRVDTATRTRLAELTRGRTAVWLYGSGFLAETADDRQIGALVGMPVSRRPDGPGQVTFLSGEEPLLQGLPSAPFGSRETLAPLWAVDPAPDITPLAKLPDGSVLVAARRTPEGLRVYIGTTDAPAAFLRNVLKASGVHVYVDTDDVVSADSRFLGLSATAAGSKRVRLPRPATVTDLTSGQALGRAVDTFAVDLPEGETRLFHLE